MYKELFDVQTEFVPVYGVKIINFFEKYWVLHFLLPLKITFRKYETSFLFFCRGNDKFVKNALIQTFKLYLYD